MHHFNFKLAIHLYVKYDTKYQRILRNYYKIDGSKTYQKHRQPSGDIRNCSYGYQIYPSGVEVSRITTIVINWQIAGCYSRSRSTNLKTFGVVATGWSFPAKHVGFSTCFQACKRRRRVKT